MIGREPSRPSPVSHPFPTSGRKIIDQAILIGVVVGQVTIPLLVRTVVGSQAYALTVVPFCKLLVSYRVYIEVVFRVVAPQITTPLSIALAFCRGIPGVL